MAATVDNEEQHKEPRRYDHAELQLSMGRTDLFHFFTQQQKFALKNKMDNMASVINIFQSVHQSDKVLLKTDSIIKIVKKILQSRKKFLDIFTVCCLVYRRIESKHSQV